MKNDTELDHLLHLLASEKPPAVDSSRIIDGVWTSIRRNGEKPSNSWLSWLASIDPWSNPQWACSGLAAALVIGLLLGWIASPSQPLPARKQTSELNVFASNAPGLPSTLLFSTP